MPSLNNIVNLINQSLISDQFKSRRYQNGSWNLIADPIKIISTENESVRPCIVDDEGECTDLTPNDNYPFIVFHRVDNPSYSINPQDDYGEEGLWMDEAMDMRMIFWGDRGKLKARPEEVMAACVIDFPKELNATQIQANKLQDLNVIIEMGSVDNDREVVYSREWTNTEFALEPNHILFAIHYRIISTFNKKCFTLCY